MDNAPISGETVFDNLSSKPFYFRKEFVPLDQSIIWEFNRVFWRHTKLWSETYGDHFEKSLPAGVSESHRPEFIQKSAEKFLEFLKKSQPSGKIIVAEEGPGTGIYAKGFLDFFKNEGSFYDRIEYVLFDTSDELLNDAMRNLAGHKVSTKLSGKALLFRNGNVWDQLPAKLVVSEKEVLVREVADREIPRDMEKFVLENPKEWKEMWRSIKLEATSDEMPVVWNTGVLSDLDKIEDMVDFEHGGYIESLDIFTDDFQKDRRPKKYDGGLGVVVNLKLVKDWAENNSRKFNLEQIRGLNSIVTIS